jgi:hypothetical protein
MDSMEVPDPDTGLVLNDLLVRAGKPLTVSCTLPVNPFDAVIET